MTSYALDASMNCDQRDVQSEHGESYFIARAVFPAILTVRREMMTAVPLAVALSRYLYLPYGIV